MKPLLHSLALLSLPLTALAEDAAPTPPPHRSFRPQSSEQVAMQMVVRQLVLNRYDADRNLTLDGEERHRLMADAHAARKQQALAFIRQFDADGDGELSPAERKTMEQAMEERRQPADKAQKRPPRPGKHGKRRPQPPMDKDGRLLAILVHQLTMDAYDADKNGQLDTAESARLREDGAALYEARRAELLARFDADGDGKLSEAEKMSALQALRPRRPQAPPPPPARAEGKPDSQPPHHRHAPFRRLLDTHFDIDIILHLAHPQQAEAGTPPPPCASSTPSTN